MDLEIKGIDCPWYGKVKGHPHIFVRDDYNNDKGIYYCKICRQTYKISAVRIRAGK